MEEAVYIEEKTGRLPKLRGFELLGYSPNINYDDATYECLKEVYDNRGTLKTAFEWAKETGDILTFSFHWFSPLYGKDKSFYAKNTEFDASKILTEGTPERKAFYHDMDVIAKLLQSGILGLIQSVSIDKQWMLSDIFYRISFKLNTREKSKATVIL